MANKVAFITGGASGIGRALAEELAEQGVEVVLADRQAALAEEVAYAIRQAGGKASAHELDVRDPEQFQRVVDETVARTGRINYLFNNAGIGVAGEIAAYTLADWDDVFDVNLRGVAYGVQAVYPVMRAQRSGHIVNTASMAGLLPTGEAGSYVASKHAVVGLSKVLRVEAKQHGVRVSALCPGVIRTPIMMGGEYGRTNLPPRRRADDDEALGAAQADGRARVRPQDTAQGRAQRSDHHRSLVVEAALVRRAAFTPVELVAVGKSLCPNTSTASAVPTAVAIVS